MPNLNPEDRLWKVEWSIFVIDSFKLNRPCEGVGLRASKGGMMKLFEVTGVMPLFTCLPFSFVEIRLNIFLKFFLRINDVTLPLSLPWCGMFLLVSWVVSYA